MRPYVVRPGDYLLQIAQRFGFAAEDVWNAAENDSLRQRRPNPQQLAPGDVLRIPDGPPTTVAFSPGGTQRYRARVPEVDLNFTLREGTEEIPDEPYELHVPGRPPLRGNTGPHGEVSARVPVTARQVELRLTELRLKIPILVGGIDPIDTPSGVHQRLANLGMIGWGTHLLDRRTPLPREQLEEAAIRRFQREYGLDVTGALDGETRRALDEAHGGVRAPVTRDQEHQ